jgi:hypothetical protein
MSETNVAFSYAVPLMQHIIDSLEAFSAKHCHVEVIVHACTVALKKLSKYYSFYDYSIIWVACILDPRAKLAAYDEWKPEYKIMAREFMEIAFKKYSKDYSKTCEETNEGPPEKRR